MSNNLQKKNLFSRLSLIFMLLAMSITSNSQVRNWFSIYADEEGKPAQFDHIVFNLNYNGWIHEIRDIETNPLSIGFDFGIYKDLPLFKTGNISFAYALNYSFVNVHNNTDIAYVTDTNSGNLYTTISKSNTVFTKNKLSNHYLEIPLELRFRKISDPKIRFYIGFKAGVLLGVHSTRTTTETKYKQYRIKNFNPYRYGPTIKIGLGKVNLFGFYSMSQMFNKGKGDLVNQFSVGLSFFAL
jgi:hypothetical protein